MSEEDNVDLGKLQSLVEGELDNEKHDKDKPEAQEDDLEEEQELEFSEESEEQEELEAEGEGEEESEEESDNELRLVGKDGKIQNLSLNELLAKTEHDIKVNGETERLKFDDLIARAQMGTDYQKKTEAVANERKELAPYVQMVAYAKKDPQFIQYVAEYINNGGIPMSMITGAAGNITDEELAEMQEEDPKKAGEILRMRGQLKQEFTRRQAYNQASVQEAQENMAAWAAEEERKTKELIPDYDEAESSKYLSSLGFSEQELSAPMDHRMKQVIDSARKYHALKNKGTGKGSMKGKRKSPLPPRQLRSGSGKPTTSNRKVQKAAYNKAVETQSDDDWVKAIAGRLGV